MLRTSCGCQAVSAADGPSLGRSAHDSWKSENSPQIKQCSLWWIAKSVICLSTSEINRTATFLPQIILWLLVAGPGSSYTLCSTVAKDVMDLQGQKVFMVGTDISRFTFGCGASMCVTTDILQLQQAPPEKPSQKAPATCPSAPVKEAMWTIPDTQQRSSTPNSSYIIFSLLQVFTCKFVAK